MTCEPRQGLREWCCRYNTYIAHYKELECMRVALEPLLYRYGVDIVFAG